MVKETGQQSEDMLRKEAMESIRTSIIETLEKNDIPYNLSREPILKDSEFFLSIPIRNIDQFCSRAEVNQKDLFQTYRELVYGVNEIINDTATGFVLGRGFNTAMEGYAEEFPMAKDFLDLLYEKLSDVADEKEVVKALIVEHMRPVNEDSSSGKLEEYMGDLELGKYSWLKDFLSDDASALEIEFIIYSLENIIKVPLKKKVLDIVMKHFSGINWGYPSSGGSYDAISGEISNYLDEDKTQERSRQMRMRALVKGLFTGITISAGGPFIPIAALVGISSSLDVLKHRIILQKITSNQTGIITHELMHQLSSSKNNDSTKPSKVGLMNLTN